MKLLRTHWRLVLTLGLAMAVLAWTGSTLRMREGSGTRPAITALGRLEPKHGVIRVAGPSHPTVVIGQLLVEEGDRVKEGQRIAVLDSYALQKAEVARLAAELESADRELQRIDKLHARGVCSDSEHEKVELARRVAETSLQRARAELARCVVRAPVSGRVIEIHARNGERVGSEGIAEIGRTDEMYAIAEVYETDIGRLRTGQRAVVRSPALERPLEGTVERIGLKIGKMDVLDTDPAARADARVVEVEIRLDDSETASALTYLQVQVEIGP